MTFDEIELLKLAYPSDKYLSVKELVENVFNDKYSVGYIRCIAAKNNLVRPVYRKYRVNDAYFDYPTLINSYWAGFIAADGCIIDRRAKYGWTDKLSIELSPKDEEHLKLLSKALEYTGPIICSKHSHGTYRQLTITSQQLCNSLAQNFNIIPRKTKVIMPPPLTGNFALAFIKGFIDGDGSIGEDKRRNNSDIVKLQLYCESVSLLQWIKQHLGTKDKNKQSRSLCSYSKHVTKILRKMYKLDTPCLQRKWGLVC